jgi:glycerol-3-phosphate responsive antiterminator
MPTIRATTTTPIWGTGFISSAQQANEVLAAGADVVSSGRLEVWRELSRVAVR